MKKSILSAGTIGVTALLLALTSCKKEKDSTPSNPAPSNPPAAEKKYQLVIDNGAQSVEMGRTLNLSAHLVNTSGAVVNASGISWSSNIGGISGNSFVLNNDTTGVISASIQYEGVTYSASVPIRVAPLKSVELFAVLPSAIIWDMSGGPIQLETVYVGNTNPAYTFSSENTNIATVSNTGLVSFQGVGSTNIKVTSTINGQTSTVTIPVLVVGTPEITMPVTRITVTPRFGELFRGETLQLNARAFNKNGDDVTNTVTFNYTIVQKQEDDDEPAVPISVNNNGLVTALATGDAYVQVTANGIMGQAEISVIPDTTILVTPFYTNLGGFDPITLQPNPTSANFTATTYKINRTAYRSGSANYLTQIPNPANLTWEIPTTGIPQIDNLFNVITISNTTNSNATATAIPGKVGLSYIIAHSGIYSGAAAIMVNP
ncbi:MAG: Ig-like domain-containing protein [Sediminibacterium sp.]|nr:Ig-like domain-containing protein [Sediminibacterium sp.]